LKERMRRRMSGMWRMSEMERMSRIKKGGECLVKREEG